MIPEERIARMDISIENIVLRAETGFLLTNSQAIALIEHWRNASEAMRAKCEEIAREYARNNVVDEECEAARNIAVRIAGLRIRDAQSHALH